MGGEMAPTYTYPGVYIKEVPSAVRTIAGVPTSVAAFVGRTSMGPVNQPVRIQNFSAFERVFGGMNAAFALPYSVQQYFQNGGADAYVVRLEKGATAAQIHIPVGVTTRQLIDAGATAPQSVQAQDEKIAGTVITVPPKALKENTTLFIAPGQQTFNQDYTYVGPAVIVGDEGIPFEKAVTLEMPIAVENIPDGKKITDVKFLVWSHKNGTLSLQAQASSDPDKKKASLATKTFSTVQPVIEAASAKPPEADPAPMVLSAKNGGAWGNALQIIVDYNTRNPADTTLFNLTVQLVDPSTQGVVASETFLNLSSDANAPSYVVRTLNDDSQFVQVEGAVSERPVATPAGQAYKVDQKGGDGSALDTATINGNLENKTGMYALEDADIFNLLIIPPLARYDAQSPDVPQAVWDQAISYCDQRRAVVLVDPPSTWKDTASAVQGMASLSTVFTANKNAAIFWPFIMAPDAMVDNRVTPFAPAGAMAGVMARTDTQTGVWKAAAGQSATIASIAGLSYALTDGENGQLNPLGLNCLRSLPIVGPVVWGARTSVGADRLASEWKYVPVRRTALYIEESLYRGLQWVVFEPNDEPLWSQIRLNVGSFMQGLFLDGAFQGVMPNQAYFVRCDGESNPQANIDKGIVTVVVGFAPLKPAEFVIVELQQITNQAGS